MARTCTGTCSSLLRQKYGQITSVCYEYTRACATYSTALWHLDVLCYKGCERHGTANGLPQPRMELAKIIS